MRSSVSEKDIESLCRDELSIQDEAVITLAQPRWTNDGNMAKDLKVAEAANIVWDKITAEKLSSFLVLKSLIHYQAQYFLNIFAFHAYIES